MLKSQQSFFTGLTMPEYTFQCNECGHAFIHVCTMASYDETLETLICAVCHSDRIMRDYQEDSVNISYVPGLSECKTAGQYAEKQSKKYGKEKCQKMIEGFKTKKTGGMKELPAGMTRYTTPEEMPSNPKARDKR